MDKDKALKLALEALKFISNGCDIEFAEDKIVMEKITPVIAKCEETLAQPPLPVQPEQEPIAKVCHDLEGHIGWNPTAQVNEFPEGMELFAAPLPVQEPAASVHVKDGLLVGSHRDESKPFPDGQYGLWPITTSPLPAQEPLHWPPSFVITPEYLDKYLAELKNENKTAQARLERVKAILAKAEKYP